LDAKAVKELDEGVDSEIDDELEEILKGGGADDDDEIEDFDGWDDSDDDGEGEDEKDKVDEDGDLDEENIAFSGSEDEFQPMEDSLGEKNKKTGAAKKSDAKSKSQVKSKSQKSIAMDDDEDEGDDDLDEFDFIEKISTKKQKLSKKVTKSNKLSDLFADAEEFSHLLEGNATAGKGKGGKGGRGFDMLGLGALSNKDKASVKQLEWESGRDKWLKGEDWRKKGKPGKKGAGMKQQPRKSGGVKKHSTTKKKAK